MTTPKPVLAFFGATGGCALNTLVLALKNGYNAVALARTPSKLTGVLTKDHSIPQSTLDAHLTIIAGSVTSPEAVKAVLAHDVAYIISGLGAAPKFQLSITRPVAMDQPTICGDAAHAILAALTELLAEGKITVKPVIVVISTTGLSKKQNDVPRLLGPLYYWLLVVPHIDKSEMERVIAERSVASDSPISGFAIVRASLLTDGEAKGAEMVRAGWERHPSAETATDDKGPGPAIGYTISRADVGGWVFREILEREDKEWLGKCATITY